MITRDHVLICKDLALSQHMTITIEKSTLHNEFYFVIDTHGMFSVENKNTSLYDGPDIDIAVNLFNDLIGK